MRLLNTAMILAEEGLMKRATLANGNKAIPFDALRSNWDVWVRLSDQDRVLWQAINAVKQQIKETWTDEDQD